MVLAVAATILPNAPNTTPGVKNQRRPNISVKRPTRVRPIARPRVKTSASQMTGPGPIAASIWLNTFKTKDEIVALSNNTEYGLMAGVITQDINRAPSVASEFDSGMVGVNCASNLRCLLMFLLGGRSRVGWEEKVGKRPCWLLQIPRPLWLISLISVLISKIEACPKKASTWIRTFIITK